MPDLMPDIDLIFSDGETWTSYVEGWLASAASGILVGTNPAYSVADFLGFYPQFGSVDNTGAYTGPIANGNVVLGTFVTLASASVQWARWQDAWQMGMALFIAHYATLYLQTQSPNPNPTAAQVYAAGLAKGIQTSKSVEGISVSYQMPEGLEGWAAWNLTVFGQQFASLAKTIGIGILYCL